MKKTFFALVERTDKWDPSKEAPEQPGFAGHAAYMHGLEDEGFIAVAGLLLETFDVVFVLLAESEEEVRTRFAQDPWQADGTTRLVRPEEAAFRKGVSVPGG